MFSFSKIQVKHVPATGYPLSMDDLLPDNAARQMTSSQSHGLSLPPQASQPVLSAFEKTVEQLNRHQTETYQKNLTILRAYEGSSDNEETHRLAQAIALDDTYALRSGLSMSTKLLCSTDIQQQKRGAVLLNEVADLYGNTDSDTQANMNLLKLRLSECIPRDVSEILKDQDRSIGRDTRAEFHSAHLQYLQDKIKHQHESRSETIKAYRGKYTQCVEQLNKEVIARNLQRHPTYLEQRVIAEVKSQNDFSFLLSAGANNIRRFEILHAGGPAEKRFFISKSNSRILELASESLQQNFSKVLQSPAAASPHVMESRNRGFPEAPSLPRQRARSMAYDLSR